MKHADILIWCARNYDTSVQSTNYGANATVVCTNPAVSAFDTLWELIASAPVVRFDTAASATMFLG